MRSAARSGWDWLVDEWQWPYAAAFAASFLLCLLPIVWSEGGAAAMLIYAQVPVYMLHQLEEHAGDRFRLYVNERTTWNPALA